MDYGQIDFVCLQFTRACRHVNERAFKNESFLKQQKTLYMVHFDLKKIFLGIILCFS